MGAAAAPILIGSAMGAATNRKNPLQGALLGGVLGGAGSAFTGFGSLGNAAANTASTAGTTGLGMAGNAAATTMPGAVGAFGQAVPAQAVPAMVPEVAPAATNLASLIDGGLSADLALDAANAAGTAGGYTGLGMAGNPAANMSFFDKLGAGAKELGQYAQQNPVLASMAVQTGQSLLQQREPQLQSPGLMRGSPSQVAAPQYQVGIPKVSLI
jgi:hypothetical protein